MLTYVEIVGAGARTEIFEKLELEPIICFLQTGYKGPVILEL
jgi:hypothetical protein